MFRTLWFWSFARVPLNFTDCEWSLNYQIPEIFHVFTVYCVWPNCNYFMAEPASGQDEANPVFLLATRAGSIGRTCTLGISRVGPARKSFLSGLFSVLIDLNSVSVHKNAAKNFANIQPPWPDLDLGENWKHEASWEASPRAAAHLSHNPTRATQEQGERHGNWQGSYPFWTKNSRSVKDTFPIFQGLPISAKKSLESITFLVLPQHE